MRRGRERRHGDSGPVDNAERLNSRPHSLVDRLAWLRGIKGMQQLRTHSANGQLRFSRARKNELRRHTNFGRSGQSVLARGRQWDDRRVVGADDIDTLVFDVLGTVVDEAGSMRAELATALGQAG
jgi:hypothetical protein